MPRFLFRVGRMVFRDGKAVTDDCSGDCCATGYRQYQRCGEGNANTPVDGCAEFPQLGEFIFVRCDVADAACGYSPGPGREDQVIIWGGGCWEVVSSCVFADPVETPNYAELALLPIPPGYPIVRDGVGCAAKGCSDPACFSSHWSPGSPCPGQTAQLDRPVFACARFFVGCVTVRVANKAGEIVCVTFKAENAIELPTPLPESFDYIIAGLGTAGQTCCECLAGLDAGCSVLYTDLVPDRPTTDIYASDPCHPWSGGRVCCCNDFDEACNDEWYLNYNPLHPDIIGRGYTVAPSIGGTTCRRISDGPDTGTPNRLILHFDHPEIMGPDVDYGSFNAVLACVHPTSGLPPDFDFTGGCNPICGNCGLIPNGDNYVIFQTYTEVRTCTTYALTIVMLQYAIAPGGTAPTLRAIWSFRYRWHRIPHGECSGGCAENQVSAVVGGVPISVGDAVPRGCAGCGDRGAEVVPA